MDSVLIKVILPLFGIVLGFFLNQRWQREKERKDRLLRLIAFVSATEHELDFYAGRLDVLAEFLQRPQPQQEGRRVGILVPSFEFYPAFLEKMKVSLVDFHETAALVRDLSECHYELGHVQAKLETLIEYAGSVRTATSDKEHDYCLTLHDMNAAALRSLAQEKACRFREARDRISSKLRELKEQLEMFYEESVFGIALRDR